MPYLLEMKSITKRFGTVKAVDNVSLRLNPGEVVSLCGENGSGKSTLMKVLCGIYPHGSYEGEIVFAGEVIQATHIRDTERKGIAIIHQELALVKHLTVLENIFLGAEISRHGVLDYDTMTLRCEKLLAQVSLHISPDTRVGDLGLGQQQLVEIAKALNKQVRLLILDEPTASLTEQETAVLLTIIRDLQNHGIACIYISHKLNEVKAISDTICVIRDGQHIGTREAAGMSEDDIITMMVGRELTALYPNEPHAKGDEVLRVENLTAWHPVNRHIKRVNNVSFSLHSGESLGIAGLVGAGRTELFEGLLGLRPRSAGQIEIKGRVVDLRRPRQAVSHGMTYLSEDRKGKGLHVGLGLRQNLTLLTLERYARPLLDPGAEQAALRQCVDEFGIRTGDLEQRAAALSGGNQQKLALAKFLQPDPTIIVLDEPTRGVDIGAKRDIYFLVQRLAVEGRGIIVISSELVELIGLCHRVVVMRGGAIQATLSENQLSEGELIAYATGTH